MEILGLLLVAVFLCGPILGIIAFVKVKSTREKLERLEREVSDLRRQMNERVWQTLASQREESLSTVQGSPVEKIVEQGIEPEPIYVSEPEQELGYTQEVGFDPDSSHLPSPSEPASPPPPVAPPPPLLPLPPIPITMPQPDRSLEMMLGTKWLNWVGALFIMMFVGYGLKYSYDNAWIGPQGRLAIGTLFGMIAIGIGEHFRRKNWSVLFQTLTGIGIATFYACVFFSFSVYKLSSPGTSFALATGVTALAVFLAVFHNAISIAILGVIGGFLSPVLISTGENHPYVLFSYILVLDLVAMSAAYFRRWHALDLLCFAGTVLMLMGWYSQYGHYEGQLTPALLFTSLFYLVFLLIPTLHALVRRETGSREGTVLIVGNALFSATMFYRLLYPEHSHALGFVILGQAVAMFLLFRAWANRSGSTNITAQSLLVLALCLMVAAVPLHLSRFGLAIVWALQGALLTWIGLRYANLWTRSIGIAVVTLAAFSLFYNLPLHRDRFLPVANIPFGSWLLVAGSALLVGWLTIKRSPLDDEYRQPFSVVAFIIGFGLLWVLPAFENHAYWTLNYYGLNRDSLASASLLVIWSAMSAGLLYLVTRRRDMSELWHFAGMGYLVTLLVFLASLGVYRSNSYMLVLNEAFLLRLVFVAALLYAVRIYATAKLSIMNQAFETVAHIALVMLTAVELQRWGMTNDQISDRITFSMISLIWGLHAFVLLWLGLRTRQRFRRYLGFGLFALVVLKVLIIDTSELEKVYRILSFGGTGLLLLGAGYFFQKYSAALMREAETSEISGDE